MKTKKFRSNQPVQRNSTMELLRIVAMLMITIHHFAYHGGFWYSPTDLSVQHLWHYLILMGGKVGVNVFVLISGFYLVHDDGPLFNVQRILKFWLQVFFYSIVIYLVNLFQHPDGFEFAGLLHACLPMIFSVWWFASVYFVLYLLHPFLNILIHNTDKTVLKALIILLVVCWSVIPTLLETSFQSNLLLWFITLYLIASYISLYGFENNKPAWFYGMIWFISSALTYASTIILALLSRKNSAYEPYITYLYTEQKITILIISVSLFMFFAKQKRTYHKWINVISSGTFGVYLLHEHELLRVFWWSKVFKNYQYQGDWKLIPYSILITLAVFAICTAVDLLRLYLLEKPLMKFLERYTKKIKVPYYKNKKSK